MKYTIIPMASAASSVPDANALLCETCGYTLTGLPEDRLCPECGAALAESAPDLRRPAPWEAHATFTTFLQTTFAVVVNTTRFYRNLATRATPDRSFAFALIHWFITSLLFGIAAAMHALWYTRFIG